MENTENPKATLMIDKAKELINSIDNFSINIPEGEIFHISNRLKHCVRGVPDKLSNSFVVARKTEQIRMAIRAFEALSECRDYLSLVEKLRYGKTIDLIQQVDEISNMLYDNYPNLKYAS